MTPPRAAREQRFPIQRLLEHRLVRLAVSACLLAALAAGSWRKWPDPIVDFGRELYVPWRLSEGAVFGRDVVTLFGPLSQSFNGLLFSLFGVSFTTLIVANLALLGWLVIVVDDYFGRFVSPVAAVVANAVLLSVFAFGQYTAFGNYNYIAPYAHEATHGIILCVTTLWLLARWYENNDGKRAQRWLTATAGVCFGLVQLAKPEPALAAAFGAAVLFFLARWTGRPVAGAALRFLTGAAAPPLVSTLLFLRHMPLMPALRTTFGAWVAVASGAAGGPFYSAMLGIDEPFVNIAKMVAGTCLVAAVAGGAILADRRMRLRPWQRRWLPLALAVVLTLGLIRRVMFPAWLAAGRPLPLIALLLLAFFVISILLRGTATPSTPRNVALAAWGGMSFACLAKVLLNAHLYGYGFTLAMPATLLLAVTLVELVPELARVDAIGSISRAIGVALVAALMIVHIRWSTRQYAARNLVIGSDGDAIVALGTGQTLKMQAFQEAIEKAGRLTPPNGTIAVLPEGILLNYLTRRKLPTRFLTYMPPELAAFSEDSMTAALADAPPDLIVVVQKDTREYGVGPFGHDPRFGRQLMTWVGQHYDPVETLLAEPFQSDRFGIEILRRRTGEETR